MTNQPDNRQDLIVAVVSVSSKVVVETWYDFDYVDPSDLKDELPVRRPYLLKIGDNIQAFCDAESRSRYLDWWRKLAGRD